jgi:prephenate dehydrogenase
MTIAIIGTGLIGGSIALSLKAENPAIHIIGVDNNQEHLLKAQQLKLIDGYASLEDAIRQSEMVILTIPVNGIITLLSKVLNLITDQVVIDMGSVKQAIVSTVNNHPKRRQYVAAHPMAGTENSGPQAAVPNLFKNKNMVLCNISESDPGAVTRVEQLFKQIGMRMVYMDAADHDLHTAYISHFPHIASFALALTVLKKEKEEQRIFELASGGFESAVRLAKSAADMWVPIFEHNRANVLDVLDEHLFQLHQLRKTLADANFEELTQQINTANTIRKILN